MLIEGVDYAFPPWPDPQGLADAGIKFACRYGGAGTSPKWLTADEAQALCAVGIAIVANVEGAQSGLLGGYSVGQDWARRADAHFKACGMPDNRPIYLSVDFDVTAALWPKVRDALAGAASVIGVDRVGVYGGHNAMLWARADEVANWFWQTYAWSGGKWLPGNHIEQYRNNVTVGGATVDRNRALKTDYGQWMIGVQDDMSEWSQNDPYGPDPDGHNRTPAQKQRDGYAALYFGKRPIGGDGKPVGPEPWIVAKISEIQARLDVLTAPVPAQVDYTKLAEALRPIVAQESEAAHRRVMLDAGTPDGATPA